MPHTIVYFVRPRTIRNFGETFTEVAEAGIHSVVLARYMGDLDLLQRDAVDRAKVCLSLLHLQSPAMHGLHSGQYDPNEADAAHRVEMQNAHLCFLEHAAEMGCRTYVCHPGSAPETADRKESWNRVSETLDRLAPRAASLGIVIALENANPGNLGDNANELLAFVENYNSSAVQICFDSGHAHRSEDALSVLRTLSSRVVTVHLHDNNKSADEHLIPGHGTIAWPSLVPLLQECPRLLHIETEPFNEEGWDHKRIYQHYCKMLDNRN